MSKEKHVYKFGNRTAEGNASMKNLLGGKGANLMAGPIRGGGFGVGFRWSVLGGFGLSVNTGILPPTPVGAM